jgi:ribosomal protein S18 acetylase RimI-like enzyme
VIALLAEPKYAILRNIRKKSALNCQVLCRTSFGLRTLLYKPTPIIERIGGFIPINQQIADHEQTISTYLLQPTKHLSCELQWRWVNQLDENLKNHITHLMNRVLQKETTIGFPSPLDDREASELLAGLNESLKSGAKYLLIAEAGDQIVAHVILTPHPLPNCAHQVEVSRLMICPSFRGTGLLTQIAQKLVLKSEILGRSLILLDVREGTLAQALWKSWGFKEYGRLPDYARVNGKTHAGIFMYQEVSSLRAAVFP